MTQSPSKGPTLLLRPSHWPLGFQHVNFGDTNIQTIAQTQHRSRVEWKSLLGFQCGQMRILTNRLIFNKAPLVFRHWTFHSSVIITAVPQHSQGHIPKAPQNPERAVLGHTGGKKRTGHWFFLHFLYFLSFLPLRKHFVELDRLAWINLGWGTDWNLANLKVLNFKTNFDILFYHQVVIEELLYVGYSTPDLRQKLATSCHPDRTLATTKVLDTSAEEDWW